MTSSEERAAFEAWADAQPGRLRRCVDREGDSPLGAHLWLAWQARAALSAREAPAQTAAEKFNVDPAWADEPTQKPQEGTWALTAPDGRTWTAESPLRVCSVESKERIPAHVALARIARGLDEPETAHPRENGMSEAIKPCPFCGSAPNVYHASKSFNGRVWLCCSNCGTEQRIAETEAEAVAAWNRRPESSPAAKTVNAQKVSQQEALIALSNLVSQQSVSDLVVRCEEILEWHRTGVLREGLLRELAQTCLPANHKLRSAEQATATEAFEFITTWAALRASIEAKKGTAP